MNGFSFAVMAIEKGLSEEAFVVADHEGYTGAFSIYKHEAETIAKRNTAATDRPHKVYRVTVAID